SLVARDNATMDGSGSGEVAAADQEKTTGKADACALRLLGIIVQHLGVGHGQPGGPGDSDAAAVAGAIGVADSAAPSLIVLNNAVADLREAYGAAVAAGVEDLKTTAFTIGRLIVGDGAVGNGQGGGAVVHVEIESAAETVLSAQRVSQVAAEA